MDPERLAVPSSAKAPIPIDDATAIEAILDTVILDLPYENKWRVADAVEGTQIFGGTGSGKTSGSGAKIAERLLRPDYGNMGGLVLTAKTEEAADWVEYARRSGRLNDLVIFDTSGRYQFNFLDYEFNRGQVKSGPGTELTHNLVSLFMNTLATGDAAVSATDPYWNDALRELLTHAIDLAVIARGQVELPDLAAIVRSAPQNRQQVNSPGWQKPPSRCFELLRMASDKAADLPEGRLQDLKDTVAYWLSDFPNLSDRTRSIIVSSFTAKATGLLRSPLRRMFCDKTSPEVLPTQTYDGKIIVLNVPVKEFGEVGRFAQILYKTVWQRATERRTINGTSRPVFLWADESQYFVTPEDLLFQQTARSKLAATVYLTQNLPNYYSVLGTRHGNAATESLLGNLQTKIFHANGDPSTNEWAEKLFGKDIKTRSSENDATVINALSQTSRGRHDSIEPLIRAEDFAKLRTGREANDLSVDAWIFKAGRQWNAAKAGEKTIALFCTFRQQNRRAAKDAPARQA